MPKALEETEIHLVSPVIRVRQAVSCDAVLQVAVLSAVLVSASRYSFFGLTPDCTPL